MLGGCDSKNELLWIKKKEYRFAMVSFLKDPVDIAFVELIFCMATSILIE